MPTVHRGQEPVLRNIHRARFRPMVAQYETTLKAWTEHRNYV